MKYVVNSMLQICLSTDLQIELRFVYTTNVNTSPRSAFTKLLELQNQGVPDQRILGFCLLAFMHTLVWGQRENKTGPRRRGDDTMGIMWVSTTRKQARTHTHTHREGKGESRVGNCEEQRRKRINLERQTCVWKPYDRFH